MDAKRMQYSRGGFMATLTIKNVPDELYQLLKETAHRQRRSINREALLRLELALRSVQGEEEALMERIRRMRGRFPDFLTEDDRKAAMTEGRR
jgi:plasmid stability protein